MNRLARLFFTTCALLLTLSPICPNFGAMPHDSFATTHSQELVANDLMKAYDVLELLQKRTEELEEQGIGDDAEVNSMRLPRSLDTIRSRMIKAILIKVLSATPFSDPEQHLTDCQDAQKALSAYMDRLSKMTQKAHTRQAPAVQQAPTIEQPSIKQVLTEQDTTEPITAESVPAEMSASQEQPVTPSEPTPAKQTTLKQVPTEQVAVDTTLPVPEESLPEPAPKEKAPSEESPETVPDQEEPAPLYDPDEDMIAISNLSPPPSQDDEFEDVIIDLNDDDDLPLPPDTDSKE